MIFVESAFLWQVAGREKGHDGNAHGEHALNLNYVCERALTSPQRSLIRAGPAAPSCIAQSRIRDRILLLPNIPCLIVELLAISYEISENLKDFFGLRNCSCTPHVWKPIPCDDVLSRIHNATYLQGNFSNFFLFCAMVLTSRLQG
jgi:hypothetical protein